ncbi:NAD(P)-binding protein [Trametes coccinea BRFM310]|uniref:NAD(P)-binding protein n=1 Tax=Trametes coccinea (strain BRFM310) TaxID=1353009 RepID=A0A1Y2ILR4_TRAC3|nr:NAD(P)-binding protein [Trametes coccinea BRFM310]
MSDPKPVVAILGGTGLLGEPLSVVFLTEYKSRFGEVRVVTRNPASETAQGLRSKGAVLYKLDEANPREALEASFVGVDAIVNLLSAGFIAAEITDAAMEAAAQSTAKVYFPSEWGGDRSTVDFDGYGLEVWALKEEIIRRTRNLMKAKKVIAVYTGAFLEIVFRPGRFNWFKVPSDVYECTGPASQRITLTSMTDIGRATARLSLLSLDPATASQVPDEVRLAGSTVSIEDIRDLIAKYTGKKAEIKCHDLTAAKELLKAGGPGKAQDLFQYLGVVAGEGKFDYSRENENEVVNPGGSLWRWKTAEEEVRYVVSRGL